MLETKYYLLLQDGRDDSQEWDTEQEVKDYIKKNKLKGYQVGSYTRQITE
jgi:hypothetical protein